MVTTVDLDRSFCVHQPIKMRGRERMVKLGRLSCQVSYTCWISSKISFEERIQWQNKKQPTTKNPQNNNNKKLSKLKLKTFSGNNILYSLCFLFPKFNSGFFIGHTLIGLSLFQCLKIHE